MTALDFAIIGVPLVLGVAAFLARSDKGTPRQDRQPAETKKLKLAMDLRATHARSREGTSKLAAVRFVPIGVIPISASRSE